MEGIITMADELNFQKGEPGAVKHGNFINYYQFYSPEQRMKNFPTHLWKVHSGQNLICLDIGCNTGNLTNALFKFLSTNLELLPGTNLVDESITQPDGKETTDCVILGIDLDPTLISRAEELNIYANNITYKCLDFMGDNVEEVLPIFLSEHRTCLHFDIIFCFSITMWIHLNHGDEGLKQFLIKVTKWTKILVIEPQPWKCYRNAMRRLKRSSGEAFPLYKSLKVTTNVEAEIERIIISDCGLKKVMETPQTSWGRRILFFKK